MVQGNGASSLREGTFRYPLLALGILDASSLIMD
jgi:hypothetical protein